MNLALQPSRPPRASPHGPEAAEILMCAGPCCRRFHGRKPGLPEIVSCATDRGFHATPGHSIDDIDVSRTQNGGNGLFALAGIRQIDTDFTGRGSISLGREIELRKWRPEALVR